MLGNIKVGLKEIGWEGLEWIHVAEDRNQWLSHVNMVLYINHGEFD
jgi:hypothetical protein